MSLRPRTIFSTMSLKFLPCALARCGVRPAMHIRIRASPSRKRSRRAARKHFLATERIPVSCRDYFMPQGGISKISLLTLRTIIGPRSRREAPWGSTQTRAPLRNGQSGPAAAPVGYMLWRSQVRQRCRYRDCYLKVGLRSSHA